IGNDTSICVGESITLNANLAGGTYLWSNSGINQTTTVNVPGTYWVDVTVNNCTNRDTLILGNTPLPAVNLGNDTTLCQGDELMLDATLANATYVWNNYTFASTYLVNQAGTYWVEVSVDNCVNSDTLNISYNPLPVFNIGNDTTLCQGDELIVDVGFPGASYLWNNGSTQPSFQMVQEGTYWVEVTFNNCSFIDSMLVEFTANPIVNIGNDTTICQGDVLNLDATQVNASYNWFDNSNGSSITVDTAGIYWVEVTVDNCSSLDSLVLDMDFAPFANLGSDTTICIGKSLVLNAAIENGSYLWQDNSTAENLFINEPGNYWIELGNNCGVDSDSIEVAFEDCNCYIYVPNAFSPNADGRNDIIMPKSNCGYLEYTFQIFNRWGDLVFETTSPRNGWTGIEGKEDAPQGVYVYLLTYQFPEGKRMMKKGSITLIR
ncbi:MAG: gliding motility-associated C-terminal domain-containing protein, partial [Bacteroidia bacterium]|nr:gliding motility-associated C-terminal domain-containing protein [Bacteroidia bacterium]